VVIAIDGPAGSGKSVIAKYLAENLKLPGEGQGPFTHINSGNLYRAITLGCVRSHIDPLDQALALEYALSARVEYKDGEVCLEGENVTPLLHTDEIDKLTALLSANAPIRHVVNDLIRNIAGTQNIIVEGRDMTSVVFPDSKYRFYLDASPEARAKRRFDQKVSMLSLEEILAAIRERDEIDKNKAEGSLKITPGTRYLDTSDLTICQVYEKLVGEIKNIQTEELNMGQVEVDSDGSPVDTSPSGEADNQKNANSQDDIQTLMENSLKSIELLEEGQLVEGHVVQITSDQVFINVGYKSEGKIPLGEFTEIPGVGDTVTVILEVKEDRHGEVRVSKQKADV
jgi:cytidylate kinase